MNLLSFLRFDEELFYLDSQFYYSVRLDSMDYKIKSRVMSRHLKLARLYMKQYKLPINDILKIEDLPVQSKSQPKETRRLIALGFTNENDRIIILSIVDGYIK
ncbi:unnamed protein product [Cunninghamella blakesleeana]